MGLIGVAFGETMHGCPARTLATAALGLMGPPGALVFLGAVLSLPPLLPLRLLCVVALIALVLAAVHHAGGGGAPHAASPGTLVLALAVTAIETALIPVDDARRRRGQTVLPRDTIFAAIMIICNGVVGICLLVGGLEASRAVVPHRGRAPASRR